VGGWSQLVGSDDESFVAVQVAMVIGGDLIPEEVA
jgi:hypothetical protein